MTIRQGRAPSEDVRDLHLHRFTCLPEEDAPAWLGWTLGQTWNGWEVPYFTQDTAREVLDTVTERDPLQRWEWHGQGRGFALYDARYEEGEPVLYPPYTFIADGEREVKLYSPGGMSWTWQRVSQEGRPTVPREGGDGARLDTLGLCLRLVRDVERFPHYVAPRGCPVKVVESDREKVEALARWPVPGAEEWGNRIHWYSSAIQDDARLAMWEDTEPAEVW